MKIYRLKKDWTSQIGNGSIGFIVRHNKGERFFKPTDKSEYNTIGPDYFPENGGYPVAERFSHEFTHKKKKHKSDDFLFVDEYFEFVGETDKPKEYFLNKKYTQEQVDKMLSKK